MDEGAGAMHQMPGRVAPALAPALPRWPGLAGFGAGRGWGVNPWGSPVCEGGSCRFLCRKQEIFAEKSLA